MPKTLVAIHGHHFKPQADALFDIWCRALRVGLERDYPDKVPLFDAANKQMVYFGELNNTLRESERTDYDDALDVADRINALESLRKYSKRKKFNRFAYEGLPGKSALPEFLADIGAPLLGGIGIGLGGAVIRRLVPELAAYWDQDSEYRRETSARTVEALRAAMQREDEVMLIAHGAGAVIAYDALWSLSHGDGGLDHQHNKVQHLLTLGSPLGNESVKRRLAGWDRPGKSRYPANIVNWHNISAEDDYVCHDKTVLDDFRPMLGAHLISRIDDYRIYNLAIRYGKSNPHSVVGYLAHPRCTKILGDWL